MEKNVKPFPLRGVDRNLHVQRSCYIALWHIDQAKHNSGSTEYNFDARHRIGTLEKLIKTYKLSYRSPETKQVSALSSLQLLQRLQGISSSKTIRRGSGFSGIIATGSDDMQPDYLEEIKQSTQYLALMESLPVPGQPTEASADNAGEMIDSTAFKQQVQVATSQHGVSGKLPRKIKLPSKRKSSKELVSPQSKRGRIPEDLEAAGPHHASTCPDSELPDLHQGPAFTPKLPPLIIKSYQRKPSTRMRDSNGHDAAIIDKHLELLSGEVDGETKQKLNANEINDALLWISREILETTRSVLTFLGLEQKRNMDSPRVHEPSEDLRRLYETCWGPEWFNIDMEPDEGLSASNVIRALTACYVYCFVFGDASGEHNTICSNFDVTSLAGAEELFFALASDNESERLDAMGQMADLCTHALGSAVQEDQCLQNTPDAHTAASRLAEIFQPHIGNLVKLATVLQKFQGEADGWCADFVNRMTDVLCAASELKCRLISSNYKYDFFWPTSGSVLDTAAMKMAHRLPGSGSQEVAFTLFPGIYVDFRDSRGLKTVRMADVVARLQANNIDEDIMM